jgi:hypothetical protein
VVGGAEDEAGGAADGVGEGLEEQDIAEARTSDRMTRTDSRTGSFFILILLYQ